METLNSCSEKLTTFRRQNNANNVRILKMSKSFNGICGFNLTRSKWDPYPWVNAVFVGTSAYVCGLKVGDCILEVNGDDVLGLCLNDIAKLVHAKSESVTLLLWNAECQDKCNDESIFCGPMPRNLTRLSTILQAILKLIECPICLETIHPPTLQCQNGHLVCVNCRIRSINCPICRDHFTPRRAHIAEELHTTITSVFNLCQKEDKLRQKLFGCKANKLQLHHNNDINNFSCVINKLNTCKKGFATDNYLRKYSSMENVRATYKTIEENACAYGSGDMLRMKSDKNHFNTTHNKLKAKQTASVKSSMKTLEKKYSESTNDLSQPLAVVKLRPLTLDCQFNETDGVADTRHNVLNSPDAPLITLHGGKYAQLDVEMALEVKSASSLTLSLPKDNASQCSCSSSMHNDPSNKERCFKKNS